MGFQFWEFYFIQKHTLCICYAEPHPPSTYLNTTTYYMSKKTTTEKERKQTSSQKKLSNFLLPFIQVTSRKNFVKPLVAGLKNCNLTKKINDSEMKKKMKSKMVKKNKTEKNTDFFCPAAVLKKSEKTVREPQS